MKKFICLALLIFGLAFLMPPPPVQAAPDHDQGISFVDCTNSAPVAIVPELEIGGVCAWQTHNFNTKMDAALSDLSLFADEYIVMKLPDVNIYYVDRLCQQTYAVNQRPPNTQDLQNKFKMISNIIPVTIRADTQKV